MSRTITESQYMELRTYEEGHPSWRNGGPKLSLVQAGYIRRTHENFYAITEAGHNALGDFRERYGVKV